MQTLIGGSNLEKYLISMEKRMKELSAQSKGAAFMVNE
jgi:hypothetical protein